MKQIIIVALALLIPCVSTVSAEVVFQQVYYDPVGTESGGEAIELFNQGADPVDLSGWIIATASSARDVVFPDGTVIAPMKPLLIADEGWQEKRDSQSWRTADVVQTMTLGNGASWVALRDAANRTVDLVGWGEGAELFVGSPALETAINQSLIRVSSTNENSRDFIAAQADFAAGVLVPVTADVSIQLPVVEVSESLTLKPEGLLVVKNNGESDITVVIQLNDLQGKSSRVPKEAVEVEGGNSFSVMAGQEYRARVRIKRFEGLVPGKYQGTLRVIIN